MSSNKNNHLITKINNILVYGSCFLVLILPIFYIGNTFFPFSSSKTFLFYGVVNILVAFWIYALVVNKSYRLGVKTYLYFIPLFLFVIWMSLSGLLAVDPSLSFWSSVSRGTGLLTLYASLIFSLIVASLVKRNGESFLYKFTNYFVWGGFLLAISVWLGDEGFNAINFLKDTKGGGLMGNSSLTAAYLLFSLGFGMFLFLKKNYEGKKWWLGTMIAIILFSPLFINIYGLFYGKGLLGSARGATLGIIVAICVSVVFYLSLSKNKVLKILGIAGVVLGIAIFSIGWMQLVNPNTKIHQKFVQAASGTRFVFDEVSQRSLDQHPWFGFGYENYPISFQKNLNPKMALPQYGFEVWSDRAHNIYYDTGVSGGYPAIFFYSVFLLSLIYGLYNLKDNEKLNHWQLSVLGGLVIGYVFQNLFVFDSTLSIMALYVLAGIIFSSTSGLTEEKYLPIELNTFKKDILPILLFIIFLVSLVLFSIRPFMKVSDYYTVAQMPMNYRGQHYPELVGGPSIGESWDVSGIVQHIYTLYNEDPQKIKNNPAMLSYAQEDIKGLIDYAEKISEKNQNDARLYFSLIGLYNTLNYFNNSQYDSVLGEHMFKIYDHLRVISPNNPMTYWMMAQTYIWKADYYGVVDSYKKSIAIDPTIPETYRLLLNFAKGTKNQKLYDDTLKDAQKNVIDFKLQ